jgi:hypothetical protein
MINSYAILVNTCDKFEDCWYPFFKLFSVFWPDYKGKIYLNTEYKSFEFPGLNIECTKVCEVNKISKNKIITWSQCLKWALEIIDSDIILYLQDDYFLAEKVQTYWIHYFTDIMTKSPEIPCIQLTQSGIPAIKKTKFEMLYKSDHNYFSFVSCQAALWQKNILLSLIRVHETAWNFEWWGSKRAKYMHYEFLVISPESFNANKNYILSYILTGVVAGKWYYPVVELFDKHGIEISYNKRGFYRENTTHTLKERIKTKVSIWKIRSIIEIVIMKILFFTNKLVS